MFENKEIEPRRRKHVKICVYEKALNGQTKQQTNLCKDLRYVSL